MAADVLYVVQFYGNDWQHKDARVVELGYAKPHAVLKRTLKSVIVNYRCIPSDEAPGYPQIRLDRVQLEATGKARSSSEDNMILYTEARLLSDGWTWLDGELVLRGPHPELGGLGVDATSSDVEQEYARRLHRIDDPTPLPSAPLIQTVETPETRRERLAEQRANLMRWRDRMLRILGATPRQKERSPGALSFLAAATLRSWSRSIPRRA
jgi:hypothetical protein